MTKKKQQILTFKKGNTPRILHFKVRLQVKSDELPPGMSLSCMVGNVGAGFWEALHSCVTLGLIMDSLQISVPNGSSRTGEISKHGANDPI